MDDEHDLTDDEFNNFDWTRWHYEGKHFEARAVSRSEFEALKRFGDYEELPNSILMRIEGDKEFRIYCDDVEKWSFGLITPGFCSMLEEAYDEMLRCQHRRVNVFKSPFLQLDHRVAWNNLQEIQAKVEEPPRDPPVVMLRNRCQTVQ